MKKGGTAPLFDGIKTQLIEWNSDESVFFSLRLPCNPKKCTGWRQRNCLRKDMHVNVQFINSNSVVICKVRRTKVNEPFMEYKAQSFWYDNFEGPVFLVGPDF